jgi:penicillin-binding protein 1A
MGYTPQLMAGGWVGADDRMIHFNTASKNGEGGRAAMPIWAYFMNKVAADPNCGLDTKLTFVKPDVMTNDITIDYINGNTPILGGEGEDVGNGSEKDYEVPRDIRIEDIRPESDLQLEDLKKLPLPKPKNPRDTVKRKPGRVPGGPSSQYDSIPKAIMPKNRL